jgi:putative FmdB family regulatory protein
MPTYAFKCKACGQEFEEFVLRFGELAPCPACGDERVERRVSAPAAHSSKGSTRRGRPASGCSGPAGSPFG